MMHRRLHALVLPLVFAAGLAGCSDDSLAEIDAAPAPADASPDAQPATAVFGREESCVQNLQTQDGYVYWLRQGRFPAVVRSPEAAYAPEVVLDAAVDVKDFDVDGGYLYWITTDRLARTDLATHRTELLPTTRDSFQSLEVVAGTAFVATGLSEARAGLIAFVGWGEREELLASTPRLLTSSGSIALEWTSSTFNDTSFADYQGISGTTLGEIRGGELRNTSILGLTIAHDQIVALTSSGELTGLMPKLPDDGAGRGFGESALVSAGERLFALSGERLYNIDLESNQVTTLDDGIQGLAVTRDYVFWSQVCRSQGVTITRTKL